MYDSIWVRIVHIQVLRDCVKFLICDGTCSIIVTQNLENGVFKKRPFADFFNHQVNGALVSSEIKKVGTFVNE